MFVNNFTEQYYEIPELSQLSVEEADLRITECSVTIFMTNGSRIILEIQPDPEDFLESELRIRKRLTKRATLVYDCGKNLRHIT